MKTRSIIGTLAAVMLAAGLYVSHATANSAPNRITTRAACKRWTSGDAQTACIACVKKGHDYFRDTGECRR